MSNNHILMTSMQQAHNSLEISHAGPPLKIQPSNDSSYPVLHVGGNSGIITTSALNMPGSSNMMPLHMSSVSNGLQITGPTVSVPSQGPTTTVPVQLPAGATINVPLQLPTSNQNHSLQLSGSNIPLHLPTTCPPPALHNSLLQVHVGASLNQIALQFNQENIETSSSNNLKTTCFDDTQTHVKSIISSNTNCNSSSLPIQVNCSQIPNSQVQLQISNNSVQRNNVRGVPHVVYVHTPAGLKPITSTDVISNASSSGNPPQIIVRRPVACTGGMQIASGSNKGSIKVPILSKSSLLAPVNAQPIVIQKPKQNSVGIPANPSKPYSYLGTVKKPISKVPESQSILVTNNQTPTNISAPGNQKMFLTPMNIPKIQNTKYILPVTMPTTISSKGPIINFQIANGQLQNDPQGNITVMSDTATRMASELPPLHPLGNILNASNDMQSSANSEKDKKNDKPFTLSIPGSRAEQTGEQEYSLSIPETSNEMPDMNDDNMYTVSISEDSLSHNIPEKSYTVTIQEKSKSLINNRLTFGERQETINSNVPAPAILRRSYSDNAEKKTNYINAKRRISLCYDHSGKKINKLEVNYPVSLRTPEKQIIAPQTSEEPGDYEVPSLFCDEQLDKDLDYKPTEGKELPIAPRVHIKERRNSQFPQCEDARDTDNFEKYYVKHDMNTKKSEIGSLKMKKEISIVETVSEEDQLALFWNEGIADLPGSDLKLQTNEFGLIDVVQYNYQTPLKQQTEPVVKKKPTSPEDLFCCENCGCHGMSAEFVTPNFCSQTCQTELLRKREKEASERGKKKKVKRPIVQKQRTLSENVSDNKDEKEIPQKCEPPLVSPSEHSKVVEQSLLQNVEDNAVNPKYPWMCGKNGFSWMRYLEHCKAKSAPVKLFKDPFPYSRNGFKVGMKLEAIDPVHPALFTVVTVAEVQGYRMRLHFDGYHENFDFWINADSPDIFPPGWCEKNNRSLRPPQGFTQSSFSWAIYLKQAKSIAAPRLLFPHLTSTIIRPNGFRVGMKLEAEDKRNSLICVATVADMMDNRLLIHFDSWDDKYDFWVDPSSPYIHPIGWADENDLSLTPPNFYKDPDTFTWEQYLVESGASAVPVRAFKPRLPTAFRPGMKLEVVDKRVPFLIRVATAAEVKPYQLRVSFDGWPDELSYWLEEDSPDIHPVGWCLKTGHPLEPPLTADDLGLVGACGTAGCRGLGSLLGGAEKTHTTAHACPYARPRPHPTSAPTPPDRLRADDKEHQERRVPVPREPKKAVFANKRGRPPKYANRDQSESNNSEAQKERTLPTRGRPPKHKRVEEVARKIEQVSDEESNGSSTHTSEKRSRRALVERSVMAPEYDARPGRRTPPSWVRLCPDVPQVLRDLPTLHSDPRSWSQTDVQDFIKRVVQCRDIAWCFCKHRIAGESFLMMSQEEMVDILGLKLGPAIKVYSTVLQLRKRVHT